MNNNYLQQLKRGTLEMIFLSLISQKSMYGSEIMNILNKEGDSFFSGAREGTVYPVFYRLEDAGLVKSVPNGNQKKNIYITDAGLAHLSEMIECWEEFVKSVDYFLSRKEGDDQ